MAWWDAAALRLIMGAGGAYNAGAAGGSSSLAVSLETSDSASPNGLNTFEGYTGTTGSSANSGVVDPAGNGAHAQHHHSVETTINNLWPPFKDWRFVRVQQALTKVPKNMAAFSRVDLPGSAMSLVDTSADRLMRANTSAGGTGGANQRTASVLYTDARGEHGGNGLHGNGPKTGPTGVYFSSNKVLAASAHAHQVSNLVATLACKVLYVTLWRNTTQDVDLEDNMCFLYEGDTAPPGWQLDTAFADHFIRIGSAAQRGTTQGDNVVSFSGTASSAGGHQHRVGAFDNIYAPGDVYHQDTVSGHVHGISGTQVWVPPYYALSVIKPAT